MLRFIYAVLFMLLLITGDNVPEALASAAHSLGTEPSKSDHLCSNFDYATKTPPLPAMLEQKMQDALMECVPKIPAAAKKLVLCAQFTTNGSLNTLSLSIPDRQHAETDPHFASAAQQEIDNIQKNCKPFSFLPADHYSSWKEMELELLP